MGRKINLIRKVPETYYNYVHPWLRCRVRWHHRFRKEDFRTLDKRNQENASFLCRLIEYNRMEATSYVAKWATIIGSRVLDLAFLGPEVEEARAEIEDIFFLRYKKHRQYHIEKLYNEIVPQLEYVDGELIRTQFLGYTAKSRIQCVVEFANNGLPPLPVPEECYQIRRPLTYPEILMRQQTVIADKLKENNEMSDIQPEDVLDTAKEMLSLLPEGKRIQHQRVHNTQLDFEGATLAWQAERVQREINLYMERYRVQQDRNKEVSPGEAVKQYHKPQQFGYRIPLQPFARKAGLLPEDFNNGYDRLYRQVLEETGK